MCASSSCLKPVQALALQAVASAGFCFKKLFHVFENDKYMTGDFLAQKQRFL